MKHLDISVRGRVQGVFFRASTLEKARGLNVRGRVCNRDDGSVFVEAEGEEQALRELLEWLRRGPPRARVDTVEAVEGVMKGYDGFEVDHSRQP